MLTKQDQYNQNLNRLEKAEVYFQTKFADDTEEGKSWAIEMFRKLILDQEKLYKELRPSSMTHDLQYGFEDHRLTLQLDIGDEIANILERLDIIRSDGWKVEKFEYLKQSKILLLGISKF